MIIQRRNAENIRPDYDWTFVDGGDEEEAPTGEVLYDKVYVKSRFCPACGAKMMNAEAEKELEAMK